jgi:hypothetical protein
VPEGKITLAEGTFESVETLGEVNRNVAGVDSRRSQYSLQLNSSFFNTPLCDNSPNAGFCLGWEQFILSNDPGSPPGQLFIQYWLISYGVPCPSEWGQVGQDCLLYGPQTTFPIQSIQNLDQVTMTAIANADGYDTFIVRIPGDQAQDEAHVAKSDSVLSLAKGWTDAEFNVFGDLTYHTAVFDPASSLIVRTRLESTKGTNPTTALESFTGETNNLTLVPPPCYTPGAIFFRETNAVAENFICPPVLSKTKRCEEARQAVGFDKQELQAAQQEMRTPECAGVAGRLSCLKTVEGIGLRLREDEIEENNECN